MSLSPSLCPSGTRGVTCPVGTSVFPEAIVLPAPGSVVGLWCPELVRFCCSDQLHLQYRRVIYGV